MTQRCCMVAALLYDGALACRHAAPTVNEPMALVITRLLRVAGHVLDRDVARRDKIGVVALHGEVDGLHATVTEGQFELVHFRTQPEVSCVPMVEPTD